MAIVNSGSYFIVPGSGRHVDPEQVPPVDWENMRLRAPERRDHVASGCHTCRVSFRTGSTDKMMMKLTYSGWRRWGNAGDTGGSGPPYSEAEGVEILIIATGSDMSGSTNKGFWGPKARLSCLYTQL